MNLIVLTFILITAPGTKYTSAKFDSTYGPIISNLEKLCKKPLKIDVDLVGSEKGKWSITATCPSPKE